MSVKANVANQNDGVITLCKIICVSPISELISGGSLHVLLMIPNKQNFTKKGVVGRNQEGVGLAIDIENL